MTPLASVKDRFSNKKDLVKAIRDLAGDDLWVERVRGRGGLARVSNRKLLHLHEVLSAVKEAVGNRSGLIDAVLTIEKRTKDEGYRTRLERWSVPRLWDHYRSVKRRAARAA